MEVYKSGTVIAGRYEIVKIAGAGGMGVVYYAVDHKQDGLPVALKTFHRELTKDRKTRERFLKEATVWLELGGHPHIVKAYSIERIEGRGEVFIVTELIGGEIGMRDASLRSWIQLGGMDWKKAVMFGIQIVWGMKHANKKFPEIVHRDLKPENILVGGDKLKGTKINQLRVTDFGLVGGVEEKTETRFVKNIALSEQHSQAVVWMAGTPVYMSPEQWLGLTLDCRADIYAWGLIMAEMLGGRQIVAGSDIEKVRHEHLNGVQYKLQSSIPKSLSRLIEKSTARDTASRPTSWLVVENSLLTILQENELEIPIVEFEVKEDEIKQRERLSISHNSIGSSYVDIGKYDAALHYYERALITAREIQYRPWEGAILGNIGSVHEIVGDHDQALSYYEQDLAITRELGNKDGEGNVLGNMGVVYKNMGQYEKALTFHEKCLTIANQSGNQSGMANALLNIGVVYDAMEKYERALDYYQQSLAIVRRLGDRLTEGTLVGNIGTYYLRTKKYKQALNFLEIGLSISREFGNKAGESLILGNIGVVYENMESFEQALIFYVKDLEISRKLGKQAWAGTRSLNIADLYLRVGQHNLARTYYEEYLAITREMHNGAGEGDALLSLGNVCQHMKDYNKALEYYDQYLVVAQELGDVAGQAAAFGNIGNIYGILGMYEKALPFAIQAHDLFERTGQAQRAESVKRAIEYTEQMIRQRRK